ncbi:hypothetical protein [Enterobacillus tribolii]|uniref:hypothetical protein n=1 Tax=Enterobacillus tribolii TaxID=1487935 RepID=UPI0011C07BE0|nr:hypothetical protein [Enterobacillus tribolii]MBW7982922.1 hypothetical protein [Enterobacillus tribolii]
MALPRKAKSTRACGSRVNVMVCDGTESERKNQADIPCHAAENHQIILFHSENSITNFTPFQRRLGE